MSRIAPYEGEAYRGACQPWAKVQQGRERVTPDLTTSHIVFSDLMAVAGRLIELHTDGSNSQTLLRSNELCVKIGPWGLTSRHMLGPDGRAVLWGTWGIPSVKGTCILVNETGSFTT